MYEEKEGLEVTAEDLYKQKDKMYVATDCIIFGFDSGSLKLLLFRRRVSPLEGNWSLIGSFVKLNEDVGTAAKRVLEEITGLKDVYMEELKVYGAADRDPGFRCISIAQYALIRLNEYDRELVKEFGAEWFDVNELPELVLDHEQMVRDALDKLKQKARLQPLGFELLPEKFTIPQLQNVYEVIFQKELDPRNFRKKVLSHNVIVKLEEKDKSSSKRGAFLYQFDKDRYQKLIQKGNDFEVW
ncbi:NUDIX hydrolase [Salinimicrobium oceani]|uniref:NUDIX hydrolase n=1 Tax=Salinimicrobium oceani TaxID=2722702 RepID=A0ABX1CX06_9FLAO|nr:NUDIX domain-containing protein [Salinimicrobium oceani]NJW51328.1 NUDIX hydrolase [Salinimicrobium oceani]